MNVKSDKRTFQIKFYTYTISNHNLKFKVTVEVEQV